jgi:hypothetical protein
VRPSDLPNLSYQTPTLKQNCHPDRSRGIRSPPRSPIIPPKSEKPSRHPPERLTHTPTTYFRGSNNSKFFWCINETTTLADCSVSHCSLVIGKLKIVSPCTDSPGVNVISLRIESDRK